MTTNQTIDGVPREQVERALDAIEQVGLQDKFIDYTFVRTVKQELRALLDAPDVESELSRMTRRCQNAELALKVQTENYESLKATQAQGQPVARILMHGPAFKGLCEFTQARTYEEFPKSAVTESNGYWLEGQPLYAEAATPIGMVLPERKTEASTDEQKTKMRGWNACLDELKRLNTK